MEKLQPYQKTL